MENKVKKKMGTDMKIFAVVCAVIVVILAAAVVYLVRPKDVATVANGKVTKAEYQYYFNQNLQYMLMFNYGSQDPMTFLNTQISEDGTTYLDYTRQSTLTQVVEIEYLLQEAKKEGYKPDEKVIAEEWGTIETQINENAKSNGLTVEEFCKQAFGIKFNQVKAINRDYIVAQKYKEKKTKEIAIAEEDIAKYYDENKASIDYNEVSHILILCAKDAEEALVKEKTQAAQDILDRVNKGEDFAALAKEFSEDGGSKDQGGVYQVQQNGQMVPEFEEWAFSHKVGETGIVRTDYGFHVMRMDKIVDTLEAQKDEIILTLQSVKYQEEMNNVLNSDSFNLKLEEGFYEF